LIENTKLNKEVSDFLNRHGYRDDVQLTPIPRGGNNRVFRLLVGEKEFLLKIYFQHIDDFRNRLKAEYNFSQFLWNHSIYQIPEPIVQEVFRGWGVYEFVKGKPFRQVDVGESQVIKAANFFRVINQYRVESEAQSLLVGSEACFSIKEHVECIVKRMERVQRINGESELNQKVDNFVTKYLVPSWLRIKTKLENQLNKNSDNWKVQINLDERCLSPSDFGFHNALKIAGGEIRFIDFEYAGWDDPAKMICDFFCQPEIPVSIDHFNIFTELALSEFAHKKNIIRRSWELLSAYRIKWCCIMLNDFLPVGNRRRDFAKQIPVEVRQNNQLDKVQLYFQTFLK